eukprot:5569588-Prymnesium_polylepis.1
MYGTKIARAVDSRLSTLIGVYLCQTHYGHVPLPARTCRCRHAAIHATNAVRRERHGRALPVACGSQHVVAAARRLSPGCQGCLNCQALSGAV